MAIEGGVEWVGRSIDGCERWDSAADKPAAAEEAGELTEWRKLLMSKLFY